MKRIICWFLGHDFDDPTHGDYCWRCGQLSGSAADTFMGQPLT